MTYSKDSLYSDGKYKFNALPALAAAVPVDFSLPFSAPPMFVSSFLLILSLFSNPSYLLSLSLLLLFFYVSERRLNYP